MESISYEDTNVAKLSKNELLKAEGNTLHQQGHYQAAYQKYSDAIKETTSADNTLLAVLYSNRAASCLALREYMDALHDGQEAAKLDPTYVKAWARIGTAAQALEIWDVSGKAWKSGLSCLPSTDPTSAQLVLKTQFEAGLKAAAAGQAKGQESAQSRIRQYPIGSSTVMNMPWHRALRLANQNKLVTGDLPSSGFSILNAYWDFDRGRKSLQQITAIRDGDTVQFKGSPTALVDLTNGLLRDQRVFHADPQFFDHLGNQCQFEAEYSGAWMTGGPKQVKKEAPERLEIVGWLPVRRALSVTVRAWIMRGYIDSNMGAHFGGVEFYKRVLDVLEWGCRTWPNVSSEDRGVIFEASFIRGVRRLYIPAVIGLYMKKGSESGYTLHDIAEMARDLKAATEISELQPECLLDPGFHLSFWVYPLAEALSTLGWYHMQLGHLQITSGNADSEEASSNFSQSSKYYIQSAEKYPEDDEHRPYFLAVALEAHWWAESPLRVTLPLCRAIRAAMPGPQELWANSQMTMNKQNANCHEALEFLVHAEKQIALGKATLNTALRPVDLMKRRAGKLKQLAND
ncbi:hypothetical protein C8J57DRAFT_10258 [Mycena rebaudengoi]|nr:hypothetical protein C8J57DRAFT_10258 [Mycena rebaudengoi]